MSLLSTPPPIIIPPTSKDHSSRFLSRESKLLCHLSREPLMPGEPLESLRHEGLTEWDSDGNNESVAALTGPLGLATEEEGPTNVQLGLGTLPSMATLEQRA